jgi:hypothetical protein
MAAQFDVGCYLIGDMPTEAIYFLLLGCVGNDVVSIYLIAFLQGVLDVVLLVPHS